jgi:hypothetical protein
MLSSIVIVSWALRALRIYNRWECGAQRDHCRGLIRPEQRIVRESLWVSFTVRCAV